MDLVSYKIVNVPEFCLPDFHIADKEWNRIWGQGHALDISPPLIILGTASWKKRLPFAHVPSHICVQTMPDDEMGEIGHMPAASRKEPGHSFPADHRNKGWTVCDQEAKI